MWGWVSRAAMSISRRNRSFPRAAPRSGLSTLRATRRRCFRSSARYTVAMPPRPSSRLIVYRSASATWSRPGTPLIRRKDTVGVGAQRAYGRGARPGLLILRPRLYRQHVTTPDPLPDDSWAVDERSLKAFADKLKAKRESRRAGAPRLRWRSERQATQRSLTWRQYRILATAESMTGKTRLGSDSCTLATTDSLYCDPHSPGATR